MEPRTLPGMMAAAEHYELEILHLTCLESIQRSINLDTACALLANAERYIRYRGIYDLVQQVLEYIDEHGSEILKQGAFAILPERIVHLILSRKDLKADEFAKFQAALMWSKMHCDGKPDVQLKGVIRIFLKYIQFHQIPPLVLMKKICPLDVVPQMTIMEALAYQADPTSVDFRRISCSTDEERPITSSGCCSLFNSHATTVNSAVGNSGSRGLDCGGSSLVQAGGVSGEPKCKCGRVHHYDLPL